MLASRLVTSPVKAIGYGAYTIRKSRPFDNDSWGSGRFGYYAHTPNGVTVARTLAAALEACSEHAGQDLSAVDWQVL